MSKLEDELKPERLKALTADQKKFLQEVLDFEEEHGKKTVMADMYQLGRVNGNNFSLSVKELKRTNMPIAASEVIRYNWNWHSTGRIYVFKEKETIVMLEQRAQHRANATEREALRIASGEAFTDAMKTISNTAASAVAAKVAAPAKPAVVTEKVLATVDSEIVSYFASEEGKQYGSVEKLRDLYVENEKFKAFIDEKVKEANS